MRKYVVFLLYSTIVEIFQLSALIFWVFKKRVSIYGTNDDALISSIASGNLTGTPDAHLIFLQPLISYPIILLENVLDNYSGYSIFLLFCVTISFTLVIVNIYIENKINWLFFTLIAFLNIVFISWFSLNPTYTGASIFSAGAASSLLILLMKNSQSPNRSIFIMSTTFLVILSYSIRIEGLYIFLVFTLPFAIKYISNLIAIKKQLSIALVVIGVAMTINSVLSLNLYSDKNWSEYMEMNKLRHKIQLREPERQMENILDEIGWDLETYQMFQKFILLDSNKMNTENMINILERTQEYVGVKSIIKSDPSNTLSAVINSLKPWTWILQIIALWFVLNLFFRITTINLLGLFITETLILSISFFILLYVLGGGFHLPERITVNALAAYFLAIIPLSINKDFKIKSTQLSYLLIVVAFIFSIFKLSNRFEIEINARENFYLTRQVFAAQQRDYLNSLGNEKLISGASSLKLDWVFPYSNFENFDQRKKTLILGWHNFSPIWNQEVEELGFDPNNLNSTISSGEALWVDAEENLADITRYFAKFETGQLKYFRLYDVGNSEYGIYQFGIRDN